MEQNTLNTVLCFSNLYTYSTKAIKQMSNGKAPGGDGIPVEVYKYGGQILYDDWFNCSKRYGRRNQFRRISRMPI